MAYYAKKVVYLSEMEYGNKIKGAGFVRMEFSGEACFLDMQISGMVDLPTNKYDISVIDVSGKKCKIGEIYIHSGKGDWQVHYKEGYIKSKYLKDTSKSEDEILCAEIAEVFIKLSDSKVISGTTGLEKNRIKAAQISEEKRNWSEQTGRKWEFRRNVEICTKKEENDVVSNEISKNDCENNWLQQKQITRENQRSREEEKKEKEEKNQMDVIILNDKWDQLQQIYPIVHPYEDDRMYISIQPKDFVIMTGDYQHLANNSFLLHGYYNYRHIILGREPDGFFYLGVPGVYYEREKMVALMFGFEAFECSGGKAEPGRFGYYLRKVRI